MDVISALAPPLAANVWLRISELKLPGPGEGAKEPPRWVYDIAEDESSALVPPLLPLVCCDPSLSRLGREGIAEMGVEW